VKSARHIRFSVAFRTLSSAATGHLSEKTVVAPPLLGERVGVGGRFIDRPESGNSMCGLPMFALARATRFKL